ncbi:MAG: epoxide hydrolase [Hyphomonadaceae bacterium]|nr:epoxide hydrolase [Hyphomonadaceae bacterium]
MTTPRPFTIAVPHAKLDAIRARVAAYPWFPAPDDEGGQWSRGVNTAFLRDLCAYWLDGYDWRAQETALNRFPQFLLTIDGIDVHFVHVVGEAHGRRPLILTHGWPGSHFEFWDCIEKLAFPSRFGGDSADAFDVVIPSLPGYGFSQKPARPLGQRATARLFAKLMAALGYDRYRAQGGDWGSLVTSWLGVDDAPRCEGIHLNMVPFRPSPPAPQSQAETAWLTHMQAAMQAEGAYFMEQSTKPQTLAYALMDSPVGACAWIVEKFHGWSDLGDHGDLLRVYTRDQLLTNVMIYLVTDSIATSVWYYRARFEENASLETGQRCETPTAVANFPGERVFSAPPRSWVERAYNLTRWTDMPDGGHFAAMERPDAFVADLRAWARAAHA